jgi:hypothetical protein
MTKQELIKWLMNNDFIGTSEVVNNDNFEELEKRIELKKNLNYAESPDEIDRKCLNYLINHIRKHKLSQGCFNES